MRVCISRIRQNSCDCKTLTPLLVYADLRDESGELLISASLEYILNAITARGYTLVSVNGVLIERS